MFACPATDDFFCWRIDHMIDLRHPLAVLASHMPWQEIEAPVWSCSAHECVGGSQADQTKPQELARVIVGNTVRHQAIAHPTDSRLLETARAKLLLAAKEVGIDHDPDAGQCGDDLPPNWASKLMLT